MRYLGHWSEAVHKLRRELTLQLQRPGVTHYTLALCSTAKSLRTMAPLEVIEGKPALEGAYQAQIRDAGRLAGHGASQALRTHPGNAGMTRDL